MDKILRIDVGAAGGPKATTVPIGGYAGLGGRAMTSAIVSKEVPPLCHPLGADNKLIIAPGLLSGSAGAMTGRISVGCKSPLTGGIKEANSGGQAAQVLARLGYAAIVLEGKPSGDDLYKIFINKDGVTITKDNSLRMLPNYDLVERMKKEHGDKIACISIGPAGEMKMAAASVAFTDMELRPTRHAGRGGVGAVMGAKNVKVIVLDDAGTSMRAPKDLEKFREANKKWVEGLKKHPVTGQGLPAFGTNVLTNILNEVGGYPTNNFTTGRFDGAAKISGETLVEIEKSRGANPTHGCHRGCVIQCSGTYNDKDGKFLTKQPEYETIWAHGGNCGISDLDKIAMMDFLDDNYGLDTIEMGATIAVAMEAGLAKFGDADAAINFIHEVGKGTHLGRILGNGAGMTGKAFGVERVPVVKNQAMPAYDPRAVQGQGVTYATSTHGRGPHRGLRGLPERPEGGRRRERAQARGPGRHLEESPDRDRGDRLHGDVPLHRVRGPRPARDLPGHARPGQRLLRRAADGRRRDGAGQAGPHDGAGLQHPGRLHPAGRPAAGVLQVREARPAQRDLRGHRRGPGQGVQLVAR